MTLRLLDLTLATPEENLALDEALLDTAEATGDDGPETLRLWESPQPVVVIGRGSRLADEVDRSACAAADVPVLRRCSGGAAIVAGPGCLMYAVVLNVTARPALRAIDEVHRFVLDRLAGGLRRWHPAIERCGISDLALAGRKFSGNSLRCKRTHLLYHGTLLYDFPIDSLSALLRTPPRQPDYRAGRTHGEFVANLPFDVSTLRRAVCEAWGQPPPCPDWPEELTRTLAREKYATAEWNQRL